MENKQKYSKKTIILLLVRYVWIAIFLSYFISSFQLEENAPFSSLFKSKLFIILIIVFTVLTIIISILAYVFISYKITDKEIILKQGIIYKKTIVVNKEKIHSINIDRTLLMQLLGLSLLRIDSGSAHSSCNDEIIIIDNTNKIKELEKTLKKIEQLDNNILDYKLTFTSHLSRVFLSLGFVCGLALFFISLIAMMFVYNITKEIEVYYLPIGILSIVMLSSVFTLICYMIKYKGFTIRKEEKGLSVKYGLFHKKDYFIAYDKVKKVMMSHDIIKNKSNLTNVRVEVIGLGNTNEEGKFNNELFPIIDKNKAIEYINELFEDYKYEKMNNKGYIRGYKFFVGLPILVTTLISIPFIITLITTKYVLLVLGLWLLVSVFIMIERRIAYKNQMFYIDNNKMIISNGSLIQSIHIIQNKNIIEFATKTTFIREKHNVVSIIIYLYTSLYSNAIKLSIYNNDKVEVIEKNVYKIKRWKVKRCSDSDQMAKD